ncbi:MAG: segregation/condensation protein A [Lachnospiraceae bacterium]|nr:segregation/condensation protein A [Lachnospiraceae bacterium]MBP1584539.1 segregation/condensation protein A [Lachnospiraceae bacterium]
MAIPVKLQVFEGPLDLLLHLIEKNKIDIYDIPIVEITAQYLEYIKQMKEENMDVCSEFLVMAATLLDIKCKMLLPVEENEEGEPEDPRAELVQQLLEYKMARQLSLELRDRQMMASQVLYRTRSVLPDEVKTYEAPVDYDELRGDMTLPKLHEIFKSMLMRQEDRIDPIRSQYGKIEKDEIDMDAKTLFVQAYAREHRTFSFRKLLEKQRSRAELIVTFLIILEMMKSGEISVVQEDINDDIMITSNVGDGNYPDASDSEDDDADAMEAKARANAEEFAEIVSETDHDDSF